MEMVPIERGHVMRNEQGPVLFGSRGNDEWGFLSNFHPSHIEVAGRLRGWVTGSRIGGWAWASGWLAPERLAMPGSRFPARTRQLPPGRAPRAPITDPLLAPTPAARIAPSGSNL